MNKEDSIKEKFKQALQSTYKVIADDYKVVKNQKNNEKPYNIGEMNFSHEPYFLKYKDMHKGNLTQLKNKRKPKIALMGLAFKPNIDDLRESPAKYIVQKTLQNANNEEFFIVEPNINDHSEFKLTSYEKATKSADIIVFLVVVLE